MRRLFVLASLIGLFSFAMVGHAQNIEEMERIDAALAAEDASQPVEPIEEEVDPAAKSAERALQLEKQLREMGTRVDSLKEDSFSTKSRLLLLREEVMRRSVSGARLVLVHRNDMGWAFSLTQAMYIVDRDAKYSRHDMSGKLNAMNNEVVFDGMLAPGNHFLTVQFVFKGSPLGIFRYMDDYTFKVESGYSFVMEEGKTLKLTTTARESGGVFHAYEDRPSISFAVDVYDMSWEEDVEETESTSQPSSN